LNDNIWLSHAADLANIVKHGASMAVSKTDAGPAMALTRALIQRQIKDLHLICVPTSGMQADLLIASGCVRTIECAGVSLDEYGRALSFERAFHEGTLQIRDSTCPAIYGGLQAAEKGVPFLPIRGLLETDVLRHHDDIAVVQNPFADDDPIALVKAINPDFCLIHAPLADRQGNVWIGRHRSLMIMAHASKQCLVTVEKCCEDNLLDDPLRGPATISALYITAIAKSPNGAWPFGFNDYYLEDSNHIQEYVRSTASEAGVESYLNEYIFDGTRLSS